MAWRDDVLANFPPGANRLTLAYDPDGLLFEEGINASIRARGYELLVCEDPITFRYEYESAYRSPWDMGETTPDLIVVWPGEEFAEQAPPADIIERARIVRLRIGDIFDRLAYPVLRELEPSRLDRLDRVYREERPRTLSTHETRDYLLSRVYDLDPAPVFEDHQLLALLLRRHYDAVQLPGQLLSRLVEVLSRREKLAAWRIEPLLSDRARFLKYLQGRWVAFVDAQQEADFPSVVSEAASEYGQEDGPVHPPFEHLMVRPLLDNYFSDGHLSRVHYQGGRRLEGTWIACGIEFDPGREHRHRLKEYFESLPSMLPHEHAPHEEWLRFAPRWGQFLLALNDADPSLREELGTGAHELVERVQGRFESWMLKHFAALRSLPPPAVVHHVPHVMSRSLDEHKLALIVVDGLSFAHWPILRDELLGQMPGVILDQRSAFAWVPTLTSISRQAIFAGESPSLFQDSLLTTSREPIHWRKFWQGHGVPLQSILYERSIMDCADVSSVLDHIREVAPRVVGLVIDTIDQLAHSSVLGAAGMSQQVRLWARDGAFVDLIVGLVQAGYRVSLTSDHGTTEGRGRGPLSEGVIADIRGSRVRIYQDQALRDRAAAAVPGTIPWSLGPGRQEYYALLAPHGAAFGKEGDVIVSHGGITVEEVIVPLVEVRV